MEDLPQFVKSFIGQSNPVDHEVEFRFYELYGPRFAVSHELFLDVTKSLTESSVWTKKESRNDRVVIARSIVSGKPDVRQIIHGKTKVYETKTRKGVQNYNNFNVRASEAHEVKIEMTDDLWATEYMPTLERSRKRNSFIESSGKWQLDLTEVQTSGEKNGTQYEVELEYISSSKVISIENITLVFESVLQMIQRSKHVVSNSFGRQLIGDYSRLLKINPRYPKFVGPLPFTLTKDMFLNGKLSCGYSVTDKADGDRKLLFIGKSGISLILSRPKDNNLLYQHVGYEPFLENSIFDGEYVNNSLFLFDTLVYKGKDVRDQPLDHRLAKLSAFKSHQNLLIKVEAKTFYLAQDGHMIKIENGVKTEKIDSDIYKISETIWKQKANMSYKLDGLIYTPILANYYNNNIFKWKDSNTIDFFVKKISETSWKLHIAGLDSRNDYVNLPFEGVNGDGVFRLRKGRNIEEIKNEIFLSDTEFKNGVITVSASVSKKFADESVVEFKFYGGKFIPMKSRLDKTYANNIRAINDAWESITKPLTLSVLKSGVYKSCTRIYHNAIKRYLISKFSTNKTVLDIGSGAGGDIMKYTDAGVRHLVGIDIVDVEYNFPSHMSFYKVNGEMYNIKNTIKNLKIGKFDTINCHFALHYFFKSNDILANFINNLNENIKQGGYFVATCMNGRNINEMLVKYKIEKGKSLTIKHKENTIFKMKKMYKDVSNIDELPIVNQKIEVKLSGTKYFKGFTSVEYLVNIEKFIEIMKTHQFKHIQTSSFADMCKKFPYECQSMNSGEKHFSFLNSFLVFLKE